MEVRNVGGKILVQLNLYDASHRTAMPHFLVLSRAKIRTLACARPPSSLTISESPFKACSRSTSTMETTDYSVHSMSNSHSAKLSSFGTNITDIPVENMVVPGSTTICPGVINLRIMSFIQIKLSRTCLVAKLLYQSLTSVIITFFSAVTLLL